MQEVGKYIIYAGAILLIIGVIVYFFADKFSWFGQLPGDIKVENENFKFYSPLVSMLIISVVLSLLIWVINKLFN